MPRTAKEPISNLFYGRNDRWSKEELNKKSPRSSTFFNEQYIENVFVKSYTFKGQKVSILVKWHAVASKIISRNWMEFRYTSITWQAPGVETNK